MEHDKSQKELSETLGERLGHWGASLVGFSYVHDALPVALKKYPYAAVIAVRLSDAIIDEITDKPTFTYFHHYRTVNTLIDQITLRGMLLIQESGYRALAIPASQTVNDAEDVHTGLFQHKTAAVKAGLGWIGKSGLFISRDYGPRVRLGTILTDMHLTIPLPKPLPKPLTNPLPKLLPLPQPLPLSATESPADQDCGDCMRCVQSCPAMALTGNCWEPGCERSRLVDVNACSGYMTSRLGHIGRGAVCGICVRVCPRGGRRQ